MTKNTSKWSDTWCRTINSIKKCWKSIIISIINQWIQWTRCKIHCKIPFKTLKWLSPRSQTPWWPPKTLNSPSTRQGPPTATTPSRNKVFHPACLNLRISSPTIIPLQTPHLIHYLKTLLAVTTQITTFFLKTNPTFLHPPNLPTYSPKLRSRWITHFPATSCSRRIATRFPCSTISSRSITSRPTSSSSLWPTSNLSKSPRRSRKTTSRNRKTKKPTIMCLLILKKTPIPLRRNNNSGLKNRTTTTISRKTFKSMKKRRL